MASIFSTPALRPSAIPPTSSTWICNTCRHKSSFRRTRKALRVKPDPAFLPSKTEAADHIIFNPPSSAPNVYHTPLKFLPKTDPRRNFSTKPSSFAVPSPVGRTSATVASRIPPSVRPVQGKKYHLNQEQIEEIRRLRKDDPKQWTRVRLAEKFECSQFFVSLCCSAPERKEVMEREAEDARAKWGKRKKEAREDRVTRKELWGREG